MSVKLLRSRVLSQFHRRKHCRMPVTGTVGVGLAILRPEDDQTPVRRSVARKIDPAQGNVRSDWRRRKRMSDSPYRVSTVNDIDSTSSRRSTSLMFWLGIALLFGAIAGILFAIYGMNSVWAEISSNPPSPISPAKIASRLSSWRLLVTLSSICCYPALLIVIIAFRRQSRTV